MRIGDGDELYREVIDGPAGRGWIVAVAACAAIAAACAWWVASRAPLWWLGVPLEILFAALAFTAWLFHRLTIVVDRAGIAWRFTLVGRRYSWDEVQMFREKFFAHSKDTQSRGWGIGTAKDGMDTYEVWGANGPCLDLVVRRGEVTKHFLVSSAVPDRLAAALVRALERRKRERAP